MSQVVLCPRPPAERKRSPALPARRRSARCASDEEIVRGIRAASESCFNELYERYFRRIYSFSYARVRNHADAEELTQETFAAIFCSIDHFRGQSSLLTWIFGIAKNTVNNFMRRSRVHDERLRQAGPGVARPGTPLEACSPEEQVTLRRRLDEIRAAFEAITPWQAEVFRLRHVENLTIREIAERTSRSSDAIRSSLYRVKRLVLETQGPAPPPGVRCDAWGPAARRRRGDCVDAPGAGR